MLILIVNIIDYLHSPDGLTNWEWNYILERDCILERNNIPKLHNESTG